jgi:hypothetical protein
VSWDYPIVERREVGVVVERRALKSQWASHRWHPSALLAEVPAAAPWTEVGREAESVRFYAGPARLELVPTETENYKYNLEGREPSAWVILRPIEAADAQRDIALIGATLSAGEAEALTDAGTDIVESVPLPLVLAEWLAAFVEKHHVERERHKRKRSAEIADGVPPEKGGGDG